jgi:two-component system LytT family sensor kinase
MSTQTISYPSHPWIWIASIWLGFGLVDAAQTVFVMRSEGMHHVWVKLFVVTVLFWVPWALATAPVVHLGERFPPGNSAGLAGWFAHLAACAAIGLTFTAWTTWLERCFDLYVGSTDPGTFVHLWFGKFFSGILSSLVLYAGIVAVSYLLESRVRLAHQQAETARLNEQLVGAQLAALRNQIEPHFLFNTLNAVSGLIREGSSGAAVTAIAGLSEYLRHTLEITTRQHVPLEEELIFTEQYLDIQKVRFADRLQVSVMVPTDLLHAAVPSLILQPIVENAVKHGIAKRLQGGMIRISASRCQEILTLRVCNDGPALPTTDTGICGVGNANVLSRLQSLYGDAFAFTMCNAETGGVEVSISLPYKATRVLEGPQ